MHTVQYTRPITHKHGDWVKCIKPSRVLSIKDLVPYVGKIANGRVLYGTTCTRPDRLQSLMIILEDKNGDAGMIALYNVSSVLSDSWRWCFPKGMQIGIKEPFLKRCTDSTVGIRVDNPLEIVFVTPICMRLGCGITETNLLKLKICTGNRQSRYCSPECQKLDWKDGHKHQCSPTRTVVF